MKKTATHLTIRAHKIITIAFPIDEGLIILKFNQAPTVPKSKGYRKNQILYSMMDGLFSPHTLYPQYPNNKAAMNFAFEKPVRSDAKGKAIMHAILYRVFKCIIYLNEGNLLNTNPPNPKIAPKPAPVII